MDVLIEIARVFGLPAALLVGLSIYHVRTIRAKDREIKRLNDARLEEKEDETERLLNMVQEFNRLQNEQQQTLNLLASSPSFRLPPAR